MKTLNNTKFINNDFIKAFDFDADDFMYLI
jgi:site-specific DNA-adenine methylase